MSLDAATASSGEPTAALLARAQQVADQLQAEARAEAERLTADLAVMREEARRLAAEVDLVAANVTLPAPPGTTVHPVTSTADLAATMAEQAATADLVVMAAAPADFTPTNRSDTKIKKSGDGGLHLDLVQTTEEFLAAAWANAASGNRTPVDLSEASFHTLAQVRADALRSGLSWWSVSPFAADAVAGWLDPRVRDYASRGPR